MELVIAGRNVVGDEIAEDMAVRIVFRDVLCALADDQSKLNLIVELFCDAGLNLGIRSNDATCLLVKPHLMGRPCHTELVRLFDMFGIVHANRQVLAGALNRGQQLGLG